MPEGALHTLEIQGVSAEMRLLHFEGYEGMSQLFEFDVTIATTETLAFDDVVRKKATLTIGSLDAGGETQTRSGIVSRIEQENAVAKSSRYRITIVPWAWMLQHRVNSRIFQAMTAPAIVEAVLEDAGASSGTDYKMSLQGTYTSREYCVQYRESDWDFVSRLLEEEGIYYYFEQAGAGDALVMADTTTSYPSIVGDATLVFRPDYGALGTPTRGAHASRFNLSEEVRSGKTTLRDWNFLKPALSLEAASSGKADTSLEVYDYPGEYDAKADGDALAKVRLDELTASRMTGSGDSLCARLLAGHTFTLGEHPRDDFNAKYLVTRVEHWGTEPFAATDHAGSREETTPYRNQFHLMPATVLFRPPRVTRRPHIHGAQTAIVVGPAGEEIYTDASGRVKVQFHWDRLGKNDDKSSCWVRVAQLWASNAFGAVFLPRIKDEVVVTFLEGDPDRPLVVGCVYHGTNVPPYALPDEKTKSTIKSRSSPGGDSSMFNELRFEDKKGSEEVFLQAQKDWTINVKNDKNQKVGHDETLEVDHDRTKTVKHDQTGTVEHDDKLTVSNDQTLEVKNDRSVTVDNDHTETVKGNQSISITKAQTVSISDKQEITVSKTRALTVTEDVTETYKAKLTLKVTDDVSETLQAKRTIDVSGDHTEKIGGKQAVTITGDSTETVQGKKSMTVTGNVTITSGSSTVTIKPSGEITVSGVQITIDASGPLKLHGATVDVKSDGPMTLKAPVINGNADGPHTVKGAIVTLDGQMINVG